MGLYGYLIAAGMLLVVLALLGRRARSQALLEKREKRSQRNRQLTEIEGKAAKLLHEGKYDEARLVLEHGVTVARQLNETEIELRFMHNLGISLYKLAEYGEAKEIFRNVTGRLADRAADDQFRTLAQSNFQRAEREFHAKTAESALAKANKQVDAGAYSAARPLFEEALSSARSSEKPLLLARVLNDFSRFYAAEKQFDKAVSQLEVALETAKKHCPKGDALVDTIQSNLTLFVSLQRGEAVTGEVKGVVARREAPAPAKMNVAARQEVIAETPPDTREAERKINDLFNRGDDFYRNHQHSNAADCYSEALDLCEGTVRNDAPLTASACNRLGMARMGDGYMAHARELFERAEAIMSEWQDRDKILHESIERNLARCRGEMGF